MAWRTGIVIVILLWISASVPHHAAPSASSDMIGTVDFDDDVVLAPAAISIAAPVAVVDDVTTQLRHRVVAQRLIAIAPKTSPPATRQSRRKLPTDHEVSL